MIQLIIIVLVLYILLSSYYVYLLKMARSIGLSGINNRQLTSFNANLMSRKKKNWLPNTKGGLYGAILSLLFFVLGYESLAYSFLILIACFLGFLLEINLFEAAIEGALGGIIIDRIKAIAQVSKVDTMALEEHGILKYETSFNIEIKNFHGFSEDKVLQYAASVLQKEDDEFSTVLLRRTLVSGIELLEVSHVEENENGLITGCIGNQIVCIGCFSDIRKRCTVELSSQEYFDMICSSVDVVKGITVDEQLVGVISITVPIREEAIEVIEQLKKQGVKPLIITSDEERSARQVAYSCQVPSVYWELNSWGKEEVVLQEKEQGKTVAMMGNKGDDKEAMKISDVSFCFGSGNEETFDAADICVGKESLKEIIHVFDIGTTLKKKDYRSFIFGACLSIFVLGGAVGCRFLFHKWPNRYLVQSIIFCISILWTIIVASRGIRLHCHLRNCNK